MSANGPVHHAEHAVAVVGMACRTSAGAGLDELWELIRSGGSKEQEVDPMWLSGAADSKGTGKIPRGNFISDVRCFDHQFFKKSRREAAALDPHQRLLLETAYQAVESAGWLGGGQDGVAETHDLHVENDIRRAKATTGCFIGMAVSDYTINLACHTESHGPSPYTAFGMLRSFAAGLLSHHFGWTGPSYTVDTACSSSMVAVHQACSALLAGECTRAVAGGVNLLTNPVLSAALDAAGFLSASGGPCRTFDVGADGYCRGEAVGVVALKPLRQALQDGDDVFGVLLATANNQNASTAAGTSITNPVLASQTALFRQVLGRAGVDPRDVSYVEAHGTGTRAGDPVEAEAIRQVLGEPDRRSVLHVGAVKPNVGHCEGASGIVSLVKVLLMIRHGQIPPQAHFRTLNPNIPALEPDRMAISTSLREWEDERRVALVNNYGASGNNAAAVVAPPPSFPRLSNGSGRRHWAGTWPFFISANSKDSLLGYCNKLATHINNASLSPIPATAPDLAFALSRKQNRGLPHVFCSTATSLDELQARLSDPGKHCTSAPQEPQAIVLLFSGQHGNTVPSVKALYDSSVLFQTHLHRCDEVVQSLGHASVLPLVIQDQGHSTQAQDDDNLILHHAAMFAIQYSCGMAWVDAGVRPAALCGHSFGEWAALTVAGALTLEEGMRVVTGRAAIIQKCWGDDPGAMVAIESNLVEKGMTPAEHLAPFSQQVTEAIEGKGEGGGKTRLRLDIACYNGPNNYVVAGSTQDIELLESWLAEKRKAEGKSLRFKTLRGMHAYHSVLADAIVDECAALSTSTAFRDPIFPFESCHEDGPWTGPSPNVVARNTRGPVYFARALGRIVDGGVGGRACTFLEAGVGGPIIGMARSALGASRSGALAAERKHTFVSVAAGDRALADAVPMLWRTGQKSVAFWPFNSSHRGSFAPVLLPPYQFAKDTSHWMDYTGFSGDRGEKSDGRISDFPYITTDCKESAPAVDALGRVAFKVDPRSRRYQDLVEGHEVLGSPICPASMYLELVTHAVFHLHPDLRKMSKGAAAVELVAEQLEIKAPLGLDTRGSIKLTLEEKTRHTSWLFELSSTMDSDQVRKPTIHATGVISRQESSLALQDDETAREYQARASRVLDGDEDDVEALRGKMVYREFRKVVKYSPMYQGMRHLAAKGSEAAGDISVPNAVAGPTPAENTYTIADPIVVDNFIQVAGSFLHALRLSDGADEEEEDRSGGAMVYICTGMGSVQPLHREFRSETYRVYTRIVLEDNKQVVLDVFVFDRQDTNNRIVWSARGLKFNRILRDSLAKILRGATSPSMHLNEADLPPSPADTRKQRGTNSNGNVLRGVQEVLSSSLDVPVDEVTRQASLEDLGADSLVRAEILANISDRWGIDVSSDEFAAMADVAALCDLIAARIRDGHDDGANLNHVGVSASTGTTGTDPSPTSTTLGRSHATNGLKKKVLGILSQSLEDVTHAEMNSRLEDLGVDSLVSNEIISRLNDAFSLDISAAEFAEMVDVESLCNLVSSNPNSTPAHNLSFEGKNGVSTSTHLTNSFPGGNQDRQTRLEARPKASSMLLHRPLRGLSSSNSSNPSLFLAPGGSGSGAVFTHLPPLVLPGAAQQVAVYALTSPFIKLCPDPPPSIEDLAAAYVAEIKRRQPGGPYLVGGYSFGGTVAYETCRLLLKQGDHVATLVLIDTLCPTGMASMSAPVGQFLASIIGRALGLPVDEEYGVEGPVHDGRSPLSRYDSLRQSFGLARRQLLNYKITKLPMTKVPRAVLVSSREGLGVCHDSKMPRPEALQLGEKRIMDWFLDDKIEDAFSLGWDEFLGDVKVIRADGNHFSMVKPPSITGWAGELTKQLLP